MGNEARTSRDTPRKILVCDTCGGSIHDQLGNGIVTWRHEGRKIVALKLTHKGKGKCDPGLDLSWELEHLTDPGAALGFRRPHVGALSEDPR